MGREWRGVGEVGPPRQNPGRRGVRWVEHDQLGAGDDVQDILGLVWVIANCSRGESVFSVRVTRSDSLSRGYH